MLESKLQAKAIAHLRKLGHYCTKVVLATSTGEPDVIACINGNYAAFEFKSDTGKATPLQEHKLGLIRASGGRAYVVNDFEMFKEIVSRLDGTLITYILEPENGADVKMEYLRTKNRVKV